MSYLGCFVIVVALGLDPFTQQIIRYVPSSAAVPHQNSSISHSLVFDKGNYATSVTGLYGVISMYSPHLAPTITIRIANSLLSFNRLTSLKVTFETRMSSPVDSQASTETYLAPLFRAQGPIAHFQKSRPSASEIHAKMQHSRLRSTVTIT